MKETFPARMRAAARAVGADLPEGARLAVELRARLSQEGHACDDVFADEEGWSFFVSTQQAPVCVLLLQTRVNGVPVWQATAQYEGGLSSIWSEQGARHGVQLALRIQAALNAHLAARAVDGAPAQGAPSP